MPTIETLDALLKHELKDLFSAETQIVDALPQMIEAANNNELKTALKQHLEVTKKQRDRLNEIQDLFGEEKVEPGRKGFFANLFAKNNEGEEHCKAMEGLIKEGNDLVGQDMSTEVKDAAIIAAAQKIEHYEISSYGTARAYALQLQLNNVARLLETTLKEEYDANDSLTVLALSKVNLDAENPGDQPVESNKRPNPKTTSKKTAKPVKKASKAAPKKTKKAAPQKTKKAAPKKAKSANRNSKTKK